MDTATCTQHTPNVVTCHCGTEMIGMNCRLHNAAPALLAALEELARDFEEMAHDSGSLYHFDASTTIQLTAKAHKARAAIALARGADA